MKTGPGPESRTPQDIEAGMLMAVTLASKRRPAQLLEVVAAADLILGFVPYPDKLGNAIERLSARGLIALADEGFTLTEAGRAIMSRQPRKGSQDDLIAAAKGQLAAWRPQGAQAPVVLDLVQLGTAVRAHKATRKTGRNLLMPKPEVTRHFKVDGHWRRVRKAT